MSRSEGENLSLIIAATQFEEHIEFPKNLPESDLTFVQCECASKQCSQLANEWENEKWCRF